MKKLEFPIITGSVPDKKQLSMDDYLEFVKFNLQNTCDINEIRKQKKLAAVLVPFSIITSKQSRFKPR